MNKLSRHDIRELVKPTTDAQKELLEELFEEAGTTHLRSLQVVLNQGFQGYSQPVKESLQSKLSSIGRIEEKIGIR